MKAVISIPFLSTKWLKASGESVWVIRNMSERVIMLTAISGWNLQERQKWMVNFLSRTFYICDIYIRDIGLKSVHHFCDNTKRFTILCSLRSLERTSSWNFFKFLEDVSSLIREAASVLKKVPDVILALWSLLGRFSTVLWIHHLWIESLYTFPDW